MTKVLVIEDEPSLRDNVLDMLAAEGFDAIGAENGLLGVRLAREHLPDLIVCDIMMPTLDGYGVLDELSRDPVTATIPFIFLTAKAERSDLRRGMQRGADDYLTKPFTATDLVQAIAARLAKHAAVNRKFQKKLDDLRRSITLALPHELRTPLSGVQTGSAILEEEYQSLERRDIFDLAHIIHLSAQRLNRLILNYLLYAEIEVAFADPALVEALRAAHTDSSKAVIADSALHQAQRARREADLSLEAQEAVVRMSETHLMKLVEELLDNAFKFSKPGTPVRVTSHLDAASWSLAVVDRGRGMTAEQIADVGAYIQFGRRIHEQQGAGLGLTIAKRLAELYGGELTIESVPGQQTTVRVRLPTL